MRRSRTAPLALGAQAGDSSLAGSLRKRLPAQTERVAVALIQNNQARWAGFGADEHSQFEIGSVTKTVTGALLATEIAAGRLGASTPVSEVINAGSSGFGRVTLEELATHRSGLPRIAGGARAALSSLITTLTKGNP